jgi:hypothetical protein
MTFPALRLSLAVATASVLAGCAAPVPIKTYEGQQLPVEESATLLVDRNIFVSDVSGYRTGITLATKEESLEGTQFDVKPGPQKIVFSYYSYVAGSTMVGVPTKTTTVTNYTSMRRTAPIQIVHDFQKGHRYELHYAPGRPEFNARIVDVTSGGSKRGYNAGWGGE